MSASLSVKVRKPKEQNPWHGEFHQQASKPKEHESLSDDPYVLVSEPEGQEPSSDDLYPPNSPVAQALEIAREYRGAQTDVVVVRVLESALQQLWAKVIAQPDTYVFTRDEFAVFNYFQHRFEGNKLAIAARRRFWDSMTSTFDDESEGSIGQATPRHADVADNSASAGNDDHSEPLKRIMVEDMPQHLNADADPSSICHVGVDDGDSDDDALGSSSITHPESNIPISTLSTSDAELIPEAAENSNPSSQETVNLGSISAVSSEIGSNSLQDASIGAQAAKEVLAYTIASDSLIMSSSITVLRTIDKVQFIKTCAKLLESLYLNLHAEALNGTQRAIADLLRSRRGRLRISRKIAQSFDNRKSQLEAEDIPRYHRLLRSEAVTRVEEDIHRLPPGPGQLTLPEDDLAYDSKDSDSEDGIEYDLRRRWDITECQEYLLQSNAFKLLQRNMMLTLVPSGLRRVLTETPKDDIQIYRHSQTSTLDFVKYWVETSTRAKWSWWPFDPPRRPLKPGELRMEWTCACGDQQWAEISAEYLQIIEEILTRTPSEPIFRSLCRPKEQPLSFVSHFKGNRTMTAASNSSSTAASRYTPKEAASSGKTTRATVNRGAPPEAQISESSGLQGGVVQMQNEARENPPNTVDVLNSRYILFGISSSSRYYIAEQARIQPGTSDYLVFSDLRQAYERHQGFWRLWFSVWIVDYCNIAKFSKVSCQLMEHEGQELPDPSNYTYTRSLALNSSQQNPGFTPHMFQVRYYACPPDCSPLWRAVHTCSLCPPEDKITRRLPKRDKGFKDDVLEDIWGVKPEFAISWIRVMLYHFLIIVGPLAFSIWWGSIHPEDTQTGPTLISVVLTAISAFWAMAGILTSRGQTTNMY